MANTKTKKRELLHSTSAVLRRWRKLRGRLRGRGPKDPIAWQRRVRHDRSIL